MCLTLGLAGCGGGTAPTAPLATLPGPTATPASEPTAAIATVLPTATPVPTLPTGTFTLAANVWWSGFKIAITGGDYDASKHTLTIDASFTNTGTESWELRQLSAETTLAWNGKSLPGFETSGIVAGGATAASRIQFAVPAGFDLSQAVLTFGKADEFQATVPLDGSRVDFEGPGTFTLAGKVTMGKFVTYTVTKALILQASCSGYPQRLKYGPLKKGLVSLVIFGTAASKDSTNYRQIDAGYLTLEGNRVDSVPAMGLSLPLSVSVPNVAMCFTLPFSGAGDFTLRMHEYRSNATGSLVFQLQ